jgi:hypothetical protein
MVGLKEEQHEKISWDRSMAHRRSISRDWFDDARFNEAN